MFVEWVDYDNINMLNRGTEDRPHPTLSLYFFRGGGGGRLNTLRPPLDPPLALGGVILGDVAHTFK